jgi:hypothetical protein
MELALIAFIIGLLVGVACGWLARGHVHEAASAASRAVTIPAADIAKLNSAVSGLGDTVKTATDNLAAKVEAKG